MAAISEKIETGTDQVHARIEDGVLVVTMDRPEARNAMGNELTPAVRDMVKFAGEDDRVRTFMLTGANRAFCAGGDVKGMATGGGITNTRDDNRQAAVDGLKKGQRELTGAIYGLRIPTIAALPGPAAGGGLAMAMSCDMRVAAQSAFVTTAYARIGLSGDYCVNWLLTRLVGTSRARELMFSAERIPAERCEALGIVNHVFADDTFETDALQFAKTFARGPRTAYGLMKDNLENALTMDLLDALDAEAENLIKSTRSPDHLKAAKAFVEKREPTFD